MEITPQPREDRHELQLKGRLDANWAEYVGNAIESAIYNAAHGDFETALERLKP